MNSPQELDPLAELSEAGVSVWLDDLSRELLAGGGLSGLIAQRHVVGVTTNPTIFASALARGERYTDQIRELRDVLGDTITGTYEQSVAHFDALRKAGVDYQDLIEALEQEGLTRFEDSWQGLGHTVAEELRAAAGQG